MPEGIIVTKKEYVDQSQSYHQLCFLTLPPQPQVSLSLVRSCLRIESGDVDQQRGGHSFISRGGKTYLTVQQHVLRDWEQKVRKALNRTSCEAVTPRRTLVSVVGYTNAGR